jgi:hypothetical protein
MNHERNLADGKRLYEPPQLVTINLRPEEAVLGHCKNSVTAGPNLGTCTAIVLPCGSVGS